MEKKIIHQDRFTDAEGRSLLVSTVYLFGQYETVVLLPGGTDLEMCTNSTEEEALRFHRKWLKKYHPTVKPQINSLDDLPPRYRKLSEDLRKAADAAREVYPGGDGGTCNFDSLLLHLPRWNQYLIEAAARLAGIRVFDTRYFGVKHYIFSTPCGGQADARTRQAECMCKVMESLGYSAGVYYQVD